MLIETQTSHKKIFEMFKESNLQNLDFRKVSDCVQLNVNEMLMIRKHFLTPGGVLGIRKVT